MCALLGRELVARELGRVGCHDGLNFMNGFCLSLPDFCGTTFGLMRWDEKPEEVDFEDETGREKGDLRRFEVSWLSRAMLGSVWEGR